MKRKALAKVHESEGVTPDTLGLRVPLLSGKASRSFHPQSSPLCLALGFWPGREVAAV